jgi:TolB protein
MDGMTLVVGGAKRGTSRVLGIVFALLSGVLYALRRLLYFAWTILRLVLTVIGGIVLGILNLFLRLGGETSRTARSAALGAATGAMARRAARAELEAGLREDPLRVQNRLLSGLVVVILAALIGVVLWATSPARTASPVIPDLSNLDVGLQSTTVDTPQPGAAAFATLVPTATAIPVVLQARGSVAYVVREKGQDDIWAVNILSRTAIRLINNPEDDRDPAWSPNGDQLAYASHHDGNWEISIYDVKTRESRRMTYDLSYQGEPQWSPDGKWLVYESYQGNNLDIYVMPVDTSQPPIRLPGNSDAPDFSPAWSPDRRHIAFVSWRDGNQDIYVFSLDDSTTYNLTNTPDRAEDYPAWSPDGKFIAFSAYDEGIEKVFVKPTGDPNATAQVLGRGRMPSWSPDGSSLVAAVDSVDSTHLVAIPFAGEGVATDVIPIPLGATHPSWTGAPLPPALVNSGGVGPAISGSLYIEQERPPSGDPPYKLDSMTNVKAEYPILSERVNDSFNALRQASLKDAGWDFLGQLQDAFWPIDRLPQPGEELHNWHKAGRAFAINRNAILGFPPPIEVVREDRDVYTYWRVYLRVADEAQSGQLGEPLRYMPWDFASRSSGDVDAYNQGGRLRKQMPAGYYIDLSQLAADYGWARVPAGSDWRANANSINYWEFQKRDGLDWYKAMRELYTEAQLAGFAPTSTPPPALPPTPTK